MPLVPTEKCFQDAYTSGYNECRCQIAYFKWNTLYTVCILFMMIVRQDDFQFLYRGKML